MNAIAPAADDLKGSTSPLGAPRAVAYTDDGQLPNALTESFVQKVFGTSGINGIVQVNSGLSVVQWSSATPTSRTTTVTHGLINPAGGASLVNFAIVVSAWDGLKSGTFNYTPVLRVTNITTTTFDCIGATVDATNPGAAGEYGLLWIGMNIGAYSGPLP